MEVMEFWEVKGGYEGWRLGYKQFCKLLFLLLVSPRAVAISSVMSPPLSGELALYWWMKLLKSSILVSVIHFAESTSIYENKNDADDFLLSSALDLAGVRQNSSPDNK